MAFVPDPAGVSTLSEILIASGRSKWTQMAILSSLKPSNPRFLLTRLMVFDSFRKATDGPMLEVGRGLIEIVGARAKESPEDVTWVLQKTDSFLSRNMRIVFLESLADGLDRGGTWPRLAMATERHLKQLTSAADFGELRPLLRLCRGWNQPIPERAQRTLAAAFETATNSTKPLNLRLPALELVSLGDSTNAASLALELIDAEGPPEIQSAAIKVLNRLQVDSIGEGIVQRWRAMTPATRPEAIGLILEHKAYHAALLTALEKGAITVGELNLDLEQRRRLLRESTPENQSRASKLLGDAEYANRKTVVAEWLAKLPPTGDVKRGKAVFESTCARCHRAGGVGSRVGPDLSAVAQRSVEDIVSNILDPNMAINPGFVAYTAEIKDADSQTGILGVQTPENVVLIQALENRVVIPREKLVKLQSEGRSLMPEGLEAGKTPQDLRDLVAFLQASP
jgi:putative heme-binding domain-containing protein